MAVNDRSMQIKKKSIFEMFVFMNINLFFNFFVTQRNKIIVTSIVVKYIFPTDEGILGARGRAKIIK